MTKSTLNDVSQGAFRMAFQILGQRADAQDVVQDAMAVARSHPSAPQLPSLSFKPWFYRVVRNRAIDQLRKRNRQGERELFEESLQASHKSEPDVIREQEELRAQIAHALQRLSFEQREIVLLKDYHGFAYQEIADILDIPTGSVMSRLHRARMNLRKTLSERAHKNVNTEEQSR